MQKLFLLLLLSLLFVACGSEEPSYVPKPKGYHYIELPNHSYKPLKGDYPYSFEISEHSVVKQDSHFLAQPSWIEITYPKFGAEIDISYKDVNYQPDSLAGFIATSHKLSYKHRSKATKIDEYETVAGRGEEKMPAMIFELEGEIPSPFHFYAHDEHKNFLRAALYFNTSTKNDSLQPIIDYLKLDMIHLLNTLEWKEPARK